MRERKTGTDRSSVASATLLLVAMTFVMCTALIIMQAVDMNRKHKTHHPCDAREIARTTSVTQAPEISPVSKSEPHRLREREPACEQLTGKKCHTDCQTLYVDDFRLENAEHEFYVPPLNDLHVKWTHPSFIFGDPDETFHKGHLHSDGVLRLTNAFLVKNVTDRNANKWLGMGKALRSGFGVRSDEALRFSFRASAKFEMNESSVPDDWKPHLHPEGALADPRLQQVAVAALFTLPSQSPMRAGFAGVSLFFAITPRTVWCCHHTVPSDDMELPFSEHCRKCSSDRNPERIAWYHLELDNGARRLNWYLNTRLVMSLPEYGINPELEPFDTLWRSKLVDDPFAFKPLRGTAFLIGGFNWLLASSLLGVGNETALVPHPAFPTAYSQVPGSDPTNQHQYAKESVPGSFDQNSTLFTYKFNVVLSKSTCS